jgi:spore germination protein KB
MVKNNFRLSNLQAMFLIASIPLGSVLGLTSSGQMMGHNIWVPMVISIGGGFLLALLIKDIILLYPGKDLAQIFESSFGSVGKIGAFICFANILLAFSFHVLCGVYFLNFVGMYHTPVYVFALIMIAISSIAAYYGLEVIARISILLILTFFVVFAIDNIFLISMADFENLLPIGPLDPLVTTTVSLTLFAGQFGVLLLALIIAPQIKDQSKITKIIFWGLMISATYFILNIIRIIAAIGDELLLHYYPLLHLLRMVTWHTSYARIDLGGILIVLTISFLLLMFCNFSLAYLGGYFLKKDYRKVILPLAIVEFVIFCILRGSDIYERVNVLCYVNLAITMLILVLLISVDLRGRYLKKRKIGP